MIVQMVVLFGDDYQDEIQRVRVRNQVQINSDSQIKIRQFLEFRPRLPKTKKWRVSNQDAVTFWSVFLLFLNKIDKSFWTTLRQNIQPLAHVVTNL